MKLISVVNPLIFFKHQQKTLLLSELSHAVQDDGRYVSEQQSCQAEF